MHLRHSTHAMTKATTLKAMTSRAQRQAARIVLLILAKSQVDPRVAATKAKAVVAGVGAVVAGAVAIVLRGQPRRHHASVAMNRRVSKGRSRVRKCASPSQCANHRRS
jgi:hypothetical protein